MLQLSQAVTNVPVMSLRTGGQVATATQPIINPNNLKIEGWYCQDRFSKATLILLSQDVRDVIKQGLIVNDHDNLSEPEELVRLKNVLDLNFDLLGMPAVTIHKKRMGKVTDFAVEIETFYISKIYLSQPLLKSFNSGTLSVDRTQIVEINDHQVVIQDPLKPLKANLATAPLPS